MKIRAFVLGIAALAVPFVAACGGGGDDEPKKTTTTSSTTSTTEAPSQLVIDFSDELVRGFPELTPARALCAAAVLVEGDFSDDTLKAMRGVPGATVPADELPEVEAAIKAAVEGCL